MDKGHYFDYLTDDIYSIASFARENLREDEKIVLYRLQYWLIRNVYLFYSDRDIFRTVYNKAFLFDRSTKRKSRYCLTTKDYFLELFPLEEQRPRVQKQTDFLILFDLLSRIKQYADVKQKIQLSKIVKKKLDSLQYENAEDYDKDGVPNDLDNCPRIPNSKDLGVCVKVVHGVIVSSETVCKSDGECENEETCQMGQGDVNNNGIGDINPLN